jgi:hypothetical protein
VDRSTDFHVHRHRKALTYYYRDDNNNNDDGDDAPFTNIPTVHWYADNNTWIPTTTSSTTSITTRSSKSNSSPTPRNIGPDGPHVGLSTWLCVSGIYSGQSLDRPSMVTPDCSMLLLLEEVDEADAIHIPRRVFLTSGSGPNVRMTTVAVRQSRF